MSGEASEELLPFVFSVQLTIHVPSTNPSNKGPKTIKQYKIKEIKQVISEEHENYIAFLKAALSKHGEKDCESKISNSVTYPFKYYCSPNKKTDAISIDNHDDYIDMVQAILARHPQKVNIMIDMLDVRDCCQNVSSAAKQNNTEHGDVDNESEMEKQLARYRKLLMDRYRNDHDNGATYVYPDGVTLTLTPFLILSWARAIYDGFATILTPPSLPAFDVKNRRPSIALNSAIKQHTRTASVGSESGAQSELMLVTQLFGHVASLAGNQQACTPSTPIRQKAPISAPTQSSANTERSAPQSSPIPHEADIPLFLEYAEQKLGVRHVTSHASLMSLKRYGPDILPQIGEDRLEEIGFAARDVVRLKKGSIKWFYSKDRKRKLEEMSKDDTRKQTESDTLIQYRKSGKRRTFYKISFPDGGGSTWCGGPPKPANDYTPEIGDVTYYEDAIGQHVSIPPGFQPGRWRNETDSKCEEDNIDENNDL